MTLNTNMIQLFLACAFLALTTCTTVAMIAALFTAKDGTTKQAKRYYLVEDIVYRVSIATVVTAIILAGVATFNSIYNALVH